MRSNQNFIPIIFIFLFVNLQALSLKEAVVQTLEDNPKVIENMEAYKASIQELDISNAGYYPTLDLVVGGGYQDISNSATRFTKESEDVYETSLILNQNLFDGFSTSSRVSADEARLMVSSYRFIEQANEIAFHTLQAYLDVLKEKELQAISVQNIQINNKIFNKVQALYDTGMTTLSEKEKIESSLSLARSNYFLIQNNYRDAVYTFKRLFGHYVDPEEMLKPAFEIELPLSREEALTFSINNNPSLHVSNYELIAAQEDYKETKSTYYPSIDAEVRQAYNSNLNGIKGDEDDFRAMLFLRYNLYNGGADSADIEKRRTVINREMARRNDIKRQITEDFDFSWNAINDIKSRLPHLEEYKQHSIKTLVLYTDEYDMGRRSLLDLLASQNDFISAKRQIVDAQYTLLSKKYYLLNTMGMLVPTVVGEANGLYVRVGLEDTNATNIQMGRGESYNYVQSNRKICAKTLSQTVAKLYGCEIKNSQIRRFSEFIFNCSTGELEAESLKRLNSVAKSLSKKDVEGKYITVISHVDDTGDKEKDIQTTQKQNEWMKKYILKKGIPESFVRTIARGSSEPLWLDKSTGLNAQNCRTDIIISNIEVDLELIQDVQ